VSSIEHENISLRERIAQLESNNRQLNQQVRRLSQNADTNVVTLDSLFDGSGGGRSAKDGDEDGDEIDEKPSMSDLFSKVNTTPALPHQQQRPLTRSTAVQRESFMQF
jgi:hypothetical protein